MIKRNLLLGLLVAASAGGVYWYQFIYGWHSASGQDDKFGLEFRYLGCNDWPEGRPYETDIRAERNATGILYRVSDPATCGYSVRLPEYKLDGETLKLSYNLYTPNGELAACICEYKSEFRFRNSPKATNVTFVRSGG